MRERSHRKSNPKESKDLTWEAHVSPVSFALLLACLQSLPMKFEVWVFFDISLSSFDPITSWTFVSTMIVPNQSNSIDLVLGDLSKVYRPILRFVS